MANIMKLEDIQVPAHLQGRTNSLAASLLAGLPKGGGYPTIGLKGTRFVVKSEGSETVLPTVEIGVVILAAKPNLDKTYYASKYDPNATEAKSPDCFSKDGITPDPTSTLKQCTSCAGCPMNQFGSGTDNHGNPGKGKACADTKVLAIFANNGIYGFKVTPASLKNLNHYVKETLRRGVDLSTGITVIGFDPNFSFPVLTFNFSGFMSAEQCAKIAQMQNAPEVDDIIGGKPTLVPPAVASAPVQQIAAPAPTPPPAPAVVPDPFAEAAPVAAEKPKVVRAVKKPVETVVETPVGEDLSDLAASLGITI